MNELYAMQSHKATSFYEIQQAIQFNVPIPPGHEFYTDFGNVRGDFQENRVYRSLRVQVRPEGLRFDPQMTAGNKVLLFLGGMRGSGKTSELARFAKKLDNPDCFYVITCNIDQDLDMNDVEYMDILIYQLERLVGRMKQDGLLIDESGLQSFEDWFALRVTEINTQLAAEGKIEVGVKSEGVLTRIFGIFGSLRAGMSGTHERKTTIRKNLKNNFSDFADRFNLFIEECNSAIRQENKGKEVLFVVDGMEKTMTAEMRRKVILDESNRLSKINAYTIFTLPIELMKERQRINSFSTVMTFPFIKLQDREGNWIGEACARFEEFIYKRVDASLFESEKVVRKAVEFCGGSPRELLRIINEAYLNVVDGEKITMKALTKALEDLGNAIGQYLTEPELQKLKEIAINNQLGQPTPFDPITQELTEKIILMEYNDGNFKKVNPVVTLSNIYKERVAP